MGAPARAADVQRSDTWEPAEPSGKPSSRAMGLFIRLSQALRETFVQVIWVTLRFFSGIAGPELVDVIGLTASIRLKIRGIGAQLRVLAW